MPPQLRYMLPAAGAIVFALTALSGLLIGLVMDAALGGILTAVLFGVATVLCAILAFRNFQDGASHATVETVGRVESKILKLAAAEGGRLTAEQTAMDLNLSVAQTKAALEQLTNQGVVDMHISGSGGMIYEFPNLLEADEDPDQDPMEALEQELGFDPDDVEDQPEAQDTRDSDGETRSRPDKDAEQNTELDLDSEADAELDLEEDDEVELDLDSDDDLEVNEELDPEQQDDLLAELESKVESESRNSDT